MAIIKSKMPFGLAIAPATVQRAMNTILHRLNWLNRLVYLNDSISGCVLNTEKKTYNSYFCLSEIRCALHCGHGCYVVTWDLEQFVHKYRTEKKDSLHVQSLSKAEHNPRWFATVTFPVIPLGKEFNISD